MESTHSKIRAFLSQHLRTDSLHADADIFASGFVNSLFAMQLVLFVENEFAIKIDNEDLTIDNFRTINALAELIDRKTVSAA